MLQKQTIANVSLLICRAQFGATKSQAWAEERQEWLASERKRFNVDEYGRYRGGYYYFSFKLITGLPQKDKHGIRGSSLGQPGQVHSTILHNEKVMPVRNEQSVNQTVVHQFKLWSYQEQLGKQWQYLPQQAVVDYDFFKFEGVRSAWAWGSTLFMVIVAIPWLLKSYSNSQNRQLTEELYELQKSGQLIEGKIINGLKVVVGQTGTLKLVEVTHHQGHH